MGATLLGAALLVAAVASAQAQQIVTMPRAPAAESATPAVPGMPQVVSPASISLSGPDRWAHLIRDASERFGIPEAWIREVMRMESGGNPQALSWAGAQGLMQVIPSTYAMLRAKHDLGPNPYEPRDNIMAGAAYIREMYELFGFPGFLAAYNAGPKRVDWFMAGTPLPAETVNYLAVISPRLAGSTVAEGPLAAFARGPASPGATGPVVVNIAEALTQYAPAPGGPQVVSTTRQTEAPPPREANGLVPRGMLNGPQLVALPAHPPASAQEHPIAVPLPPQVVASLLRANRR